MKVPYLLCAGLAGLCVLLSSPVATQEMPREKSLGEVAKEHREAGQKARRAGAVFGNDDLGRLSGTTREPTGVSPSSIPGDSSPKSMINADCASQPGSDCTSGVEMQRSSLERSRTPDEFVIPAGTKIKVDLRERVVLEHVQVGLIVAIPRSTPVTVQPARVCLLAGYYDGPPKEDRPGVGPQCTLGVTLVGITIDGERYQLHSDAVLPERSLYSETAVLTTTEPLTILRR